MKTIIDPDSTSCYLCGAAGALECHHVYGGANRKASDRYGLTVRLCHHCHNEPPNGVHYNAIAMHALREDVQRQAMNHYGWTVNDFIRIFGKNYLT